ncbi:hypothetical protein ACHAWF_008016, partial [Thalassiosira exigua]
MTSSVHPTARERGVRGGAPPRALAVVVLLLLLVSAGGRRATAPIPAAGFVVLGRRRSSASLALSVSGKGSGEGEGDDVSAEDSSDASSEDDDGAFDSSGLSWRLAKVRLEEANTRRFLRRKPLKLSYDDSRRWIQRNWAPSSRQEFEDLVANGNLRTPYISKRPEEYYGARGEWISWEHYLLGEDGEGGDEGGEGGG